MASQTGYYDAGGFGEGIPPDLRSRDLPSKRLLGKGLASIGYETEWKGERYARLDFVGVPSDIFRHEAAALVRLKDVHENVVKTYGLTFDKLSCSLLMEYMDDKLSDLLKKRMDQCKRIPASTVSGNESETARSTTFRALLSLPFELQEALDLMLQIAKGMEYLHEQGILHGDLKTRNILVTYMNNDDTKLIVKSVKVSDFGLAQTKRNSMSNVSRQARKLDMVRWKAPEILKESSSSESDSNSDEECTRSSGVPLRVQLSVDVYSFAMTCSQILTSEEPYPKRNWKGLVADIVSGKLRPKLPPSCPEMLSELLKLCWDTDPNKRPPFLDIRKSLEHLQRLQMGISNEAQKPINAYQLEHVEKETMEDPVEPEAKSVFDMIVVIRNVLPRVTYNKNQCKRIADRFNTTGDEEMKSMKVHEDSEVFKILKRGQMLVQGYAEPTDITAREISRGDNRDEFREFHEDLHIAWAKLGFPSLLVVEDSDLLDDAEKDKEAKLKMNENISRSSSDEVLKKKAQMNLRELIYKAAGGKGRTPFNFEKALLIITKIALGMVHLHSRGLVHRDLKPENVLVRDYNEKSIDVKIADFGESHLERISGSFFDGVGSVFYRAPEVFPLVMGVERLNSPINEPAKRIVLKSEEAKRNLLLKSEEANTVEAEFKKLKLQKNSAERVKLLNDSARLIIENLSDKADLDAMKATDVYSFGMVCYKVLTGQDPYSGVQATDYFMVWNGLASLEWPSYSHPHLRLLVEHCVHLDPTARPTFEQICRELHEITQLSNGITTPWLKL